MTRLPRRPNYTIVTEMERLSGWLLWFFLETLKASFNVPSDDQDSHSCDLSVSTITVSMHRSGKVVRVTALMVTWYVEACLQRLQWRRGQPSWRPLHFSVMFALWVTVRDSRPIVKAVQGGCQCPLKRGCKLSIVVWDQNTLRLRHFPAYI